jgi:hypothetical protein
VEIRLHALDSFKMLAKLNEQKNWFILFQGIETKFDHLFLPGIWVTKLQNVGQLIIFEFLVGIKTKRDTLIVGSTIGEHRKAIVQFHHSGVLLMNRDVRLLVQAVMHVMLLHAQCLFRNDMRDEWLFCFLEAGVSLHQNVWPLKNVIPV